MAIINANGMTREMTEGINKDEKYKAVKNVCPLVVRKLMRARICTVQIMQTVAVITALNKIKIRFRMYNSRIRIGWTTPSIFNFKIDTLKHVRSRCIMTI